MLAVNPDDIRVRFIEAQDVVTAILDRVGDQPVHTLVVGHDAEFMVSFHLRPLSNGVRTSDMVWPREEEGRIDLTDRLTNPFAVAAAARKVWSDVTVYDCRCTCCCGDLTEVAQADIDSHTP